MSLLEYVEPTGGKVWDGDIAVLVKILLLWIDTMTKASLIKTFNWGWLTGSKVQSTIIKEGAGQYPGKHGAGGAESSMSSSKGG